MTGAREHAVEPYRSSEDPTWSGGIGGLRRRLAAAPRRGLLVALVSALFLFVAGGAAAHTLSNETWLAALPAGSSPDVALDAVVSGELTFVAWESAAGEVTLAKLAPDTAGGTKVEGTASVGGYHPVLSALALDQTVCVGSWSSESSPGLWGGNLSISCFDRSLNPTSYASVNHLSLTGGANETVSFYRIVRVSATRTFVFLTLTDVPGYPVDRYMALMDDAGAVWRVSIPDSVHLVPPMDFALEGDAVRGAIAYRASTGITDVGLFRINLTSLTATQPEFLGLQRLSAWYEALSVSISPGFPGAGLTGVFIEAAYWPPGSGVGDPILLAHDYLVADAASRLVAEARFDSSILGPYRWGFSSGCAGVYGRVQDLLPTPSAMPVVFTGGCSYNESFVGRVLVGYGDPTNASASNVTEAALRRPVSSIRIMSERDDRVRLLYTDLRDRALYTSLLTLELPSVSIAFVEPPPSGPPSGSRVVLNFSVTNGGRVVALSGELQIVSPASGAVLAGLALPPLAPGETAVVGVHLVVVPGRQDLVARLNRILPADDGIGTKSVAFSVESAITAPQLFVNRPSTGDCTGPSVVFEGIIVDPDVGESYVVEYSIGGGPWAQAAAGRQWSFAADLSGLPSAPSEVVLRATDGNATSGGVSMVLLVNNEGGDPCDLFRINGFWPALNVTAREGESTSFGVDAWDYFGRKLSFEWVADGAIRSDRTETEILVPWSYASSGLHALSVEVDNGVSTIVISWNVMVDEVRNQFAPFARVEVLGERTAGVPVTFSGEGSSDPDGDALTYRWFVDENAVEGAGARTDHVFVQPGDHHVRLVVSDGAYEAENSTILTIRPVPQPFLAEGSFGWALGILAAASVLAGVAFWIFRRRRVAAE